MRIYQSSRLLFAFAIAWLTFNHLASAQLISSQNNTFNSTATITGDQSELAGINGTIADNVAVALNFERSNYAHGPAAEDDFYHVPINASTAPAGALLKVEESVNASLYTLPPNTALSRILFQTKNLNGSLVPASAFVLWPYLPRGQPDGFPVVGWAHGTSGVFGNCAPSNVRNLWYQFSAPYTLALQGYVVVAPDYAGLGVNSDATGAPIPHQYLANPAQANDLFYSVQAAQSAFDVLSKQFVLMGHSQGGGAAWAAAQRQAVDPVDGYLGSIAGSPLTSFLELEVAGPVFDSLAFLAAPGLSSVFPEFQLADFLLPAGQGRLALASEIQGCQSVTSVLFGSGLAQPEWSQSVYAKALDKLVLNGGREIGGPMLVIQGEDDPLIPFPVTTSAVDKTCDLYSESQLEYVTFAGVTHVPVMYAAQRTWLRWIEDRFAGCAAPQGCHRSNFTSARPYQHYQADANWFLEFATQAYEIA
ncbi:MAG: hypothetical protein M1837_004841 [Sclerophora amabilis]|nr:MAG: hypothetical protein M1837_004841 [Sclerophora amabilis]